MNIASRHVLGICVLGVLGCASAGCAADATDGSGVGKEATGDTAVAADGQPADKAVTANDSLPAQEGLTIVKSDPQWGLKAVFKEGAHAILMERRIGLPRQAEKLAENPKLGPFEDDMLVTNEDGRVIMLQKGGDQLVDPTWQERFDESVQQPLDFARRTAELALMERAADQLLTRPEALEVGARSSINGVRIVAQRPLADYFRESESDGMSYGPGYGNIDIHMEWFYPGSEHSATWASFWGTTLATCNHGNCAYNMGRKCISYGIASTAVHNNCSTTYNWNSEWGHNCHDDTVLQLWSFKYGNYYSSTGGVCNNATKHIYSPSCGTTSW